MGITARGGWECVKRHFRELGRDIQRQSFTVAGIGDMSGDVFGNGLLQSRTSGWWRPSTTSISSSTQSDRTQPARAPAALQARALGLERLRPPAALARRRHLRAQRKSITLSAEMRALLDLQQPRATPVEIIRAVLCMRVDLLWNGGIVPT